MLITKGPVDAEFRRQSRLGRVAVSGVLESARDRDEDLVRRWRVAKATQRLDFGLENVAGLHLGIEVDPDLLDLPGDLSADVHRDDRLEIARRGAEVDAGVADTMTIDEYRAHVRQRRAARARR